MQMSEAVRVRAERVIHQESETIVGVRPVRLVKIIALAVLPSPGEVVCLARADGRWDYYEIEARYLIELPDVPGGQITPDWHILFEEEDYTAIEGRTKAALEAAEGFGWQRVVV